MKMTITLENMNADELMKAIVTLLEIYNDKGTTPYKLVPAWRQKE